MGHNPSQRCVVCRRGRTRGPRFMRCDECIPIANKAKAKERLGVRSCERCERPAVYRRRLCSRCQPDADRERLARKARATARYRAKNPEKVRACQRAAEFKNRENHLKRNRLYQRGRRVESASSSRRWKAKSKPWSAKRTAILRAQAQAAVPRTWPPDVRDDAIGAIILSVLEGKLDQNAIAAEAPKFVRAELGRYRDVSLDDFVPGTTFRRIDNLRAPEIL